MERNISTETGKYHEKGQDPYHQQKDELPAIYSRIPVKLRNKLLTLRGKGWFPQGLGRRNRGQLQQYKSGAPFER